MSFIEEFNQQKQKLFNEQSMKEKIKKIIYYTLSFLTFFLIGICFIVIGGALRDENYSKEIMSLENNILATTFAVVIFYSLKIFKKEEILKGFGLALSKVILVFSVCLISIFVFLRLGDALKLSNKQQMDAFWFLIALSLIEIVAYNLKKEGKGALKKRYKDIRKDIAACFDVIKGASLFLGIILAIMIVVMLANGVIGAIGLIPFLLIILILK